MSCLSGLDLHKFKDLESEQSRQLNCTTKYAALTLAFDLRGRRIRSAIQWLCLLYLPYLVEWRRNVYPEKEPELYIVYTICEKINFNICCSQTLEFARRFFMGLIASPRVRFVMKNYFVVIGVWFGTRMKFNWIRSKDSRFFLKQASFHY
jgi:hypothetical protein